MKTSRIALGIASKAAEEADPPAPLNERPGQAPLRRLHSVHEVCTEVVPMSRAQLYRLLGAGRLDAVKIGRSTYITADSLSRFIAGLPAAKVRAS